MKQEMMGWQWHQLDHTQIICTSLQTDNHASTSSLNFFTGQMPFLTPVNNAKKAPPLPTPPQPFYGFFMAADRQPRQHKITQFFTGRMLFLTLSQQCQSTEGRRKVSTIADRCVPRQGQWES